MIVICAVNKVVVEEEVLAAEVQLFLLVVILKTQLVKILTKVLVEIILQVTVMELY